MASRAALLSVGFILLSANSALAQTPFYITGSIGAWQRTDDSRSTTFFNSRGQTGAGTNTTTFNPGPVVDLGLGYHLPLGFRIEGELGYAHYSTDTASPLGTTRPFASLDGSRLSTTSGGDLSTFTATVNGFYDLPVGGWIVPYVGAGAGYYHAWGTDSVFGGRFTQHARTSDNALVLGEVGLSFKVSDTLSVVPAYRFEHLFASGEPGWNVNIFKLGVRYAF
jgi:opacity protein-like surface antigen